MKAFIYLTSLFVIPLVVLGILFQNCKATEDLSLSSTLIDPAFRSLIEKYDRLKNRYIETAGSDRLRIHFDNENTLDENILGQCNRSNYEILIHQSKWNALSQTGKEVFLFHQLGICDLGKQLVDDTSSEECPPSLMIDLGNSISNRIIDCYENASDDYHEELFSGTPITSTSIPPTTETSETTRSTEITSPAQQCLRIASCDVSAQGCQNGDKRPHRSGDSETHHKWECHGDCDQYVECEKKMACNKQQKDDGFIAVGEKCLPTCQRFARSNTQGVTIGIGGLCEDNSSYNILLIQGTAEGSSSPSQKCCRRSSKITCGHPSYQHLNGNCFPNCGHAAGLAGWKLPNVRLYDNGGGGFGGFFRPTTSDCNDLSYNRRTDWHDFEFYDPYRFANSKNTQNIYLPMTNDKYGCCIRGTPNVTGGPVQRYDSKGWHPSDY